MQYEARLSKARYRLRDHFKDRGNVKLSKSMSKAVLEELCPWCEFQGICRQVDIYGGEFMLCKIKSDELRYVWIRITDDRPKVNIGDKFGKLTVEASVEPDLHGHRQWSCKCDCGKNKIVQGSHLLNGDITSCGCNRGGDHKSTCFQSDRTSLYKSEEKRYRKYHRGSSTNPDGTRHVFAHEYFNRIGCAVAKCECGGMIRFDKNSCIICDKCFMIRRS